MEAVSTPIIAMAVAEVVVIEIIDVEHDYDIVYFYGKNKE